MPELYIITGSNGAGKSTAGFSYLPTEIQNKYTIFDGDKLFVTTQRKLWAEGITAHKESRKLALQFVVDTFEKLIAEALSLNETFVYEGHFTNEATWDTPRKFKAAGYLVNMIFFGLATPNLSEMRVLDRVKYSGGHFVPRATVESNFFGNLEKLNKYFSLFDTLTIVDTSEADHIVLSIVCNGALEYSAPKEKMPEWYKIHLSNIASL